MSSKKEESKVLEMAGQRWAFYTTQNEHGLTSSGEGTMAQGLPKARMFCWSRKGRSVRLADARQPRSQAGVSLACSSLFHPLFDPSVLYTLILPSHPLLSQASRLTFAAQAAFLQHKALSHRAGYTSSHLLPKSQVIGVRSSPAWGSQLLLTSRFWPWKVRVAMVINYWIDSQNTGLQS